MLSNKSAVSWEEGQSYFQAMRLDTRVESNYQVWVSSSLRVSTLNTYNFMSLNWSTNIWELWFWLTNFLSFRVAWFNAIRHWRRSREDLHFDIMRNLAHRMLSKHLTLYETWHSQKTITCERKTADKYGFIKVF